MKNAMLIALTVVATSALESRGQSNVRDFGPPIYASGNPAVHSFAPPVQLTSPYALERHPYANAVGYQPVNYPTYRPTTAFAPADVRPSLVPAAQACRSSQAYLPPNVANYPGYYARYPQVNSGAAYWSSTQPRQYDGQTLFGSPTVYAKDQPLRNFFRFLAP